MNCLNVCAFPDTPQMRKRMLLATLAITAFRASAASNDADSSLRHKFRDIKGVVVVLDVAKGAADKKYVTFRPTPDDISRHRLAWCMVVEAIWVSLVAICRYQGLCVSRGARPIRLGPMIHRAVGPRFRTLDRRCAGWRLRGRSRESHSG